MTTLTRIIQGSVIAGFLLLSSGCIIAPEHEHEHEHERDRHCDDRDDHCREH